MLSSSPSPLVRMVKSVMDVKAWLIPQMTSLHGHKKPHCFKFIFDEGSQSVKMYCRMWSKQIAQSPGEVDEKMPWCKDDEAVALLKVPYTTLRYIS